MFLKKRKRFLTKEDIQDTQVASRKYLLKRQQKRIAKIYFIIGALLFSGVIFFCLLSHVFDLRGLDIDRENYQYSLITDDQIMEVFNQQITQKRFLFFSQKNIFVFDDDDFNDQVKKLMQTELVATHKKMNFRLQLRTIESGPAVVFIFDNNYYYLDVTGNLIRPLLEEEILDISLIKLFFSVVELDQPEENLTDINDLQELPSSSSSSSSMAEKVDNTQNAIKNINQEINSLDFLISKIDANKIDFVLEVKKSIEDILPEIKVSAFEFLDPQVSDVRVHTNQDYVIYFDQEIELARQISNLKIILEQKLKNKNIKYIDLRYKDRIYYQE
jgi:hypothetical protein